MGIDLYFAGSSTSSVNQTLLEKGYYKLYSYLNDKSSILKVIEQMNKGKINTKLFVDSGAYSAWTKDKVINVDEYIVWLNTYSEYIHLYGQLDVIPGDKIHGATKEQVEEAAKATWENYLYMKPKMKNPDGLLYTFHVGEPFNYLKQALEWKDENGKYIPYIALGGMVGKSTNVRKAFLDNCFKLIKSSSNPNVKVHAFGMTSFDLLSQYPITSADSTSWIMVGANGNIMTDVGILAVSDLSAKLPTHYSHLPIKYQEGLENTLAEYHVTLQELKHNSSSRIIYNADYMNKKAKELKQEYKVKKSLF